MNNFFRDQELFQKLEDIDQRFPGYDYNDLPLSENLKPLLRKFQTKLNTQYVDTSSLESAKLFGTNRKVYFESVYANPTFKNKLLSQYLDKGYNFKMLQIYSIVQTDIILY